MAGTTEGFRSHHDMGGAPAGPVAPGEHTYDMWEKRVDALMVLLSSPQKQLMCVDELRRAIESLPPDAYERMSYYERWVSAIHRLMVEKGVLTQAEVDRRIAELKARGEGRP